MATQLEIVNMALGFVGQGSLTDIDELSQSAELARQYWALALETTLRAHPWNFATKVSTLVETTAQTGFDYAFKLPADCLRPLEIAGSPTDAKFEVRGNVLLTDNDACQLKFITRVNNPDSFDIQFSEALAYRLAAYFSIPVSGKLDLQKQLLGLFYRSVQEAKQSDAQERKPVDPAGVSLIASRN